MRKNFLNAESFVPMSNGRFINGNGIQKYITQNNVEKPVVGFFERCSTGNILNPNTSSKTVTVRMTCGADIVGNEHTTVLVFDNGIVRKKLSELKKGDIVLQKLGYFRMNELDKDKNYQSFSYMCGLWIGKGARYYKNKASIKLHSYNEGEILSKIDDNQCISEKTCVDESITLSMTKQFAESAKRFLKDCKAYSIYEIASFVKGLFDGGGYVYYKRNHYELGIKLTSSSMYYSDILCKFFQSIGIQVCKKNGMKVSIGNGYMDCVDIHILGKKSFVEFERIFGFTNSFKNNILKESIDAMDDVDSIKKQVGSFLCSVIYDDTSNFGNLDDDLAKFLKGESMILRDRFISLFEKYKTSIEIVYFILGGGYLSSVNEIKYEICRGKMCGFDTDERYYAGSCYVDGAEDTF